MTGLTKDLDKKLKIEHSYPHCWRCMTPLIYYARESWYIRTSKHKDKLIALAQALLERETLGEAEVAAIVG